MKVLFLQEQPEVLHRLQQPRDANPGVGGTSYLTSQIAYELHRCCRQDNRGIDIYLGYLNAHADSFHGIPVVPLGNQAAQQCWDVVVATGGSLDHLAAGTIRLHHTRLIAWIHHPFDHDKIQKARSLGAELLSIGKAQYLSNVLVAGPHHHIDNLFCADRIRRAAGWDPQQSQPATHQRQQGLLRIGYMGGLIPSKGFHLLAQQWPAIQQALEALSLNARLEVIGGSNLYRFDQGHPQLPCDRAYGERLSTILGGQIGRSVIFHGTLDTKRYALMQQCDLAIVNPSGAGEAFPATILEWLSLGVPVITSQRYGCADAMQLLPSLSIERPSDIPRAVQSIAEQSDLDAQQLRHYCAQIGSSFSSQQALIIQQWLLLLTKPDSKLLINEYLPAPIRLQLLRSYAAAQLQRVKQSLKDWLKQFLPHR